MGVVLLWAGRGAKGETPMMTNADLRWFRPYCFDQNMAAEKALAVRDAVAAGEIDAQRHGRYVALRDDMKTRWRDRYG